MPSPIPTLVSVCGLRCQQHQESDIPSVQPNIQPQVCVQGAHLSSVNPKHVCACMHACACMHVRMFIHICVPVSTCVWKSDCLIFCLLRQNLSLTWNSSSRLSWLASEPQDPPHCRDDVHTTPCLAFDTDAGRSNSVFRSYLLSLLPSPVLFNF